MKGGQTQNRQSNESPANHTFQDMLNHSFSDLQDNEYVSEEQKTQHIAIDSEETQSAEALIANQSPVKLSPTTHTEPPSSLSNDVLIEQESQTIITQAILRNIQFKDQNQSLQKNGNPIQVLQQQYIQKIKIIYSHSFLGSKKTSLSQIKSLKVFLFLPKHGQQLVKWGNQKFGTQHTVTSALQRLQYIQDSQWSCIKVKFKQNIKYVLILILCIVILKLFI